MVNNPNAAVDRHTFPPAPQLPANPLDNLHEAILKTEFNAVNCDSLMSRVLEFQLYPMWTMRIKM